MEANLIYSAIILHLALGIVLWVLWCSLPLLLETRFRNSPVALTLCTILVVYVPSGFAFWSALRSSPPTSLEVALVAFAISSGIAIVFLWAGFYAGLILYPLLKKRLPSIHLKERKGLAGIYLTILLQMYGIFPLYLLLFGVFVLVSYAYGRIDWSVPYAERIIKIGLPSFLVEAFSITGDTFDQVRGLFVLLILLAWTIAEFFFVLARKGLLARFYANLLRILSFFLLLGGGGALVALGQARDKYILVSALFAFPAGYIIAALAGMVAIDFADRHFVRRSDTSDTIDLKPPLVGALLGFVIVWILPFSASLFVAQVAVRFAHTAFIVDLFDRSDQFLPSFWIWLGRFADLIAVFGLGFGLLRFLRRGRQRDRVMLDLLTALLIYGVYRAMFPRGASEEERKEAEN